MSLSAPSAPRDGARWRVAAAFALITALYATARAAHEPQWPTDFDQLWHAARALLAGENPYAAVGPGRPFQWDWPLYYPLPAVLYTVPFTLLPIVAARVAFSTLAAGMLGWAMGSRVRVLWPLLLSAAFIISVSRTQWAPVLLAAAWVPALGFLTMAKPNVGIAALASLKRRGLAVALAGSALALAVCFVARPDWVSQWSDAAAVSPHILAPVLLPGGFLLALAAFRWRRPDARLFLALAVLPHTPSLYDLLLLFFVCRTLRDSIGLALLTQCLYWGLVLFGSFNTFDDYARGLGLATVYVVYLPVLIAIMRRPNVAEDAPRAEPAAGWREALPQTRPDAVLSAILLVLAFLLLWLPLVTYR